MQDCEARSPSVVRGRDDEIITQEPRLTPLHSALASPFKQTGVQDNTTDLKFIEALEFALDVDRFSQSEPLLQADGNTFSLGKLRGYSTIH